MNEAETTQAIAPVRVTPVRIALWILVGGAGIFMIAAGIVGILVKAL